MSRWLLGLFLLAAAACATAGPRVEASRDLIQPHEIRESSAANAYDLVQALRPQWLRVRGTQNVPGRLDPRGSGLGAGEALGQDLVVYLDNARLGGRESLRQVPLTSVQFIRRFDAAAATHRWGAGHTHGVIFVSTLPLAQP